jgi:hypothetical protein
MTICNRCCAHAALALAAIALAVALGCASAARAADPAPREPFDHLRTGFPLSGAHLRVDCESCHPRAVFEGTRSTCGGCHGAGRAEAGGKPARHIPSSNRCDDCHTTFSFASARFDHGGVTGSCTGCHNGQLATGKGARHFPTSADCGECHNTISFANARFDHSAVTGSCFSCHNGTTATGKNPGHIQSSNQCEDCHSTSRWTPATRFDHAGITGNCASCHNGTTATGKTPNHIQSSSLCEDCHTPAGWTPARFDHSQVTGSCGSCHNGVSATGKNPGHFVTAQECDTCHATARWVPSTFQHRSAAYPGNHAGNPPCTACHGGNSEIVTWSMPAYQPDCAGCHANDFKPGPHRKIENPATQYTASELRDCSGACHTYSDATLSTITSRRSGEHSVSRRDW